MKAYAPGRVNLIGDHTDYSGGLVLPLAVDLGTTIEIEPGGATVELESDVRTGRAVIPLDVADPTAVSPEWARYIAGVVAVIRPRIGGIGAVTTTLPVGGGLSSSTALTVAAALALGFTGDAMALATTCQEAEQWSSGVPGGIMDQIASAGGVAGHALLIDCATLTITPVAMPDDVDVVVIDSGEPRALASSAYAARRAELEAGHPRRVAHVASENERVAAAVDALRAGDAVEVGRLMVASHTSLRDDYEVSTPRLDALVARLVGTAGVFGARLTGAGFGGCVVALTAPGALDEGWVVRPSAGARLL